MRHHQNFLDLLVVRYCCHGLSPLVKCSHALSRAYLFSQPRVISMGSTAQQPFSTGNHAPMCCCTPKQRGGNPFLHPTYPHPYQLVSMNGVYPARPIAVPPFTAWGLFHHLDLPLPPTLTHSPSRANPISNQMVTCMEHLS